jgi:hypothetical protein
VWDWDHLFFRDKWIIRKIADRYLPRELSQRRKRPFPTNAFGRWQISQRFFENSFVTDLFGLTRPRLGYLLDNASHALKLRLLHLGAWGHVCILGLPKTELAARLREGITVTSRADRQATVIPLPASAAGRYHPRAKRKIRKLTSAKFLPAPHDSSVLPGWSPRANSSDAS